MKKRLVTILIIMLACSHICVHGEEVPPFEVMSQSVHNGQQNVSLTPQFVFEFNLRIDPVSYTATLDGRRDLIEKIELTEGKILKITLKEPLEFESEHTLSLLGVKEIYQSQSLPLSDIRFKTISDIRLISKTTNNDNLSFSAVVQNNSVNKKEIVFILSAIEKESNRVLGVKVLRKEAEGKSRAELSYSFEGITEKCEIKAVGYADFDTLTSFAK